MNSRQLSADSCQLHSAVEKIEIPASTNKWGRGGLPREFKEQMLADYYRLKSIRGIAKIYGRSNQCVWEILKTFGCEFVRKNPLQKKKYRGEKYTPGKGGYFRSTRSRDGKKVGGEVQLHRRVWADNNGAIPAGYQVGFKDGDKNNCALKNLICLPAPEMTRRTQTGVEEIYRIEKRRTESEKEYWNFRDALKISAPEYLSRLERMECTA